MAIQSFTNSAAAIQYISNKTQSGTPLSEAELKGIIAQLKNDYMVANVTDPKWKAALVYSGASGSEVESIKNSSDIAENLGRNSGGKVLTIGQTVAGQVLGDEIFETAMIKAAGSKSAADNIIFGVVDSSGNRIQTGMWDDISKSMASNIKVPVSTITPYATNGGTYSTSELDVLLHSNAPTIDGISRANLLSEYNALGANDAALAKIRGYISDASYAHLHQLHYGLDSAGNLVIGADKAFFNGAAGLGDIHLPSGSLETGAVSSYFGDLDGTRLSSFVDTAHFLAKYGVLDKLGTAGDLLAFSVAANTAIQLYNAGDEQGANKAMTDWALDFTGGVAGGIAGGQLAAGLLALAPLLSLTPPGMVASSILLAIGIIGGSVAGGWGAAELNDLIGDAAGLFGRAFTSPIVIDLNNSGFDLVHAKDGAHFDIDGDGFAEKTGWVKPADAFLVRDVNGNGVIDNQKEMFGTDATSTAAAKLAALDSNHDGFVSSADSGWAALRLWKDANGDGVSQANELFTLASQGVEKLGVVHSTETDKSVAGNVVDWQATWYKTGGAVGGAYGDVLFETNQEDSWYVGADTTKIPTINPEALLLALAA